MPRDESWLNVNQIVRLVTLPRLPNDVAVLVVVFFFLNFYFSHCAASLTSAARILRRPFSISSCEEKKTWVPCFPRSCPCGGYRLVACFEHTSTPRQYCVPQRGRRLFRPLFLGKRARVEVFRARGAVLRTCLHTRLLFESRAAARHFSGEVIDAFSVFHSTLLRSPSSSRRPVFFLPRSLRSAGAAACLRAATPFIWRRSPVGILCSQYTRCVHSFAR